MRVLMAANSFFPAVGGYERVALSLAEDFISRGHELRTLTFSTASPEEEKLPFPVYRNPSSLEIIRLLRWCDLYLQNNVSFKLLWPLLFCNRPLVVIHHGFYRGADESVIGAWKRRLKHFVTLFSTNISVSRAIAATLPAHSHVVLNPYRDELFFRDVNIAKTKDLFFVGRMVPDKGVDVLLKAVSQLKDRGLEPTLTLAGTGPAQAALENTVKELKLEKLATFVGRVSDDRLNALLNEHRIMVVPTREGEGFGVVALEGIAGGCVVVGSSCGGLPEAIGKCGRIFENGNSSSLANILFELLSSPESGNSYLDHAESHLARHKRPVVTDQYLSILENVVALSKGQRTAAKRT